MKLPSLVVDILGNNKGLKDALGDSRREARGFSSDIGGMLKAGAAAAAAAITVSAAISTASMAVDTYKEAKRAMDGLNATLEASAFQSGVTGAEIKQLAGDLQGLTNFGDDATISAARMLAGFDSIKGDVFKDALKAGQDLAEFSGQDLTAAMQRLGKALDDPTRGMDQLRRQGIGFSSEQKRMIRDLQASGDLIGAQEVLLQAINSRIGGYAEAVVDPVKQLKEATGDFWESLGGMLTPAVDELATSLTELIKEATASEETMEAIGSTIKDLIEPINQLVKGTTWLVKWWNETSDAAPPLAEGIKTVGLNADGSIGKLDIMARSTRSVGDEFEATTQRLTKQERAIASYVGAVDEFLVRLDRLEKMKGKASEGWLAGAQKWAFGSLGELPGLGGGKGGIRDQIRQLEEAQLGLSEAHARRIIAGEGGSEAILSQVEGIQSVIDELSGFNKLMEETQKRIFTLNNSEIDVKVRDAELAGVSGERLSDYRAALEEEKRLLVTKQFDEESKRLAKADADEIKRVRESLRTPGQQLAAEGEQLRSLIGTEGFSADEAMRALKQRAKDLLGPEAPNDITTGRITAVSGSDAMSAILAAQRDADNPQNKIAKNSEMQLKEQQEIKKALNEQLAQLKQTPPVYVASSKP